MGYFHASKLLKLAFLSSLTRKYVLWKGFYHDFSTKNASASGGFAPSPPSRGSAPWTPTRGAAPWTPEVPSPPNDLPWRRPCYNYMYVPVPNYMNCDKMNPYFIYNNRPSTQRFNIYVGYELVMILWQALALTCDPPKIPHRNKKMWYCKLCQHDRRWMN